MNELKMDIKKLTIPLTEKDVRSLNIGDLITLTGLIFTGTDVFHKRAVEENILPPIDYTKQNVLVHAPMSIRRSKTAGWEPMQWHKLSFLTTAGARFDPYMPSLIKLLGLRAVISKSSMGEKTKRAMEAYGCVHLTQNSKLDRPGTTDSVRRVVDVYGFDEFGPFEATWVIEVQGWGPFIVDIDAHGNNLFDRIEQAAKEKMKTVWAHFGIPEDFRYAAGLPDSGEGTYYSR